VTDTADVRDVFRLSFAMFVMRETWIISLDLILFSHADYTAPTTPLAGLVMFHFENEILEPEMSAQSSGSFPRRTPRFTVYVFVDKGLRSQ